jgi:SAM-dependent methyltransferase
MKQFLERIWRKALTVGAGNESAREAWVSGKLAALPAGARLLDAGAGQLRYKKYCSHLKYVAQDFGGYDGQGDGAGQHTGIWDTSGVDIRCDITAIPEPDASFDAILCVEVLEHVPAPTEALREFSRLLKPGGRLILTAPFVSMTHFAPYHYYSGFNRYFYEYHLPRFGFAVTELTPSGSYFEFLAQETRRLPSKTEAYTGRPWSLPEKALGALLLALLQRIARHDSRSWEFLCYGFHVTAAKAAG